MFRFFDYPQNWDEIRKIVYKIDHWTCQRCGARNVELHAHHLIPISEGGSNEIGNLITLCKDCHTDMHFNMKYGWILKLIGVANIFLVIINPILLLLGLLVIIGVIIGGIIDTSKARGELFKQLYGND
jgi:hypothetical protein